MFIEIIAQEAIRGKSFIADEEEEDSNDVDDDDESEPRLLGKSNYSRRTEMNRDRNQWIDRSSLRPPVFRQ